MTLRNAQTTRELERLPVVKVSGRRISVAVGVVNRIQVIDGAVQVLGGKVWLRADLRAVQIDSAVPYES